jgi:hypothetical protein
MVDVRVISLWVNYGERRSIDVGWHVLNRKSEEMRTGTSTSILDSGSCKILLNTRRAFAPLWH